MKTKSVNYKDKFLSFQVKKLVALLIAISFA